MGKVRDEGTASPTKAEKKSASGRPQFSTTAAFFGNLFSTDRYKPNQGRYARIWTAIGLGVILAAGIHQFYWYALSTLGILWQYSIPVLLGLAAAWLVWRVIEFHPFADFLIATESEMNKVSWISRDELFRATSVVLTTVLIISLFLFGVDIVWSKLLQAIGVLKFDGGGGFGSQAG